jgi:SMODS-associating 2TM, beta-strand rich effector domain
LQEPTTSEKADDVFVISFPLFLVCAGIWLAYRNYSRGKGDRPGAWRLACVVFLLEVALFLTRAHLKFSASMLFLLLLAVSTGLFMSGSLWTLYICTQIRHRNELQFMFCRGQGKPNRKLTIDSSFWVSEELIDGLLNHIKINAEIIGCSALRMILVVKQTFHSISCTMFTMESESFSRAAQLEVEEESGSLTLSYNYTNRSKATMRDKSPIHDGATHLRVISVPMRLLEGDYWTGRCAPRAT